MNVGIVGLPNVGKSTLFRALTKKQVDIANYPFCTIQPNTGIVKVPDDRLASLAKLSRSESIIPASIEFVDIAGLVKGASQGEGLGNQFLAHIREVDAIAHVVRVFADPNVIHVHGEVHPKSDIEIINLELIYADIAMLEKRISTAKARLRSGSDRKVEQTVSVFERLFDALQKGKLARTVELNDDEEKIAKDLQLLTRKPFLYIFNTSEDGSADEAGIAEIQGIIGEAPQIRLCAKIEAEIVDFSPEELLELGMTRSGLDTFIKISYDALSLITYLTTGPKETRAWTIKKETKAPQAAAVIHTDFEKAFIRAEVINWKELLNAGSEVAAKEKGLVRIEGKEYIVQDGDVIVFRVGV